MEASPRYDGPPVLTIEGAIDDQRETVVRQRRRMVDALAGLSDQDWRTPSRCDGWTVQDVAAHLAGVNGFWRASIAGGLAGEPTRFLATSFDPKATPAAMVDAMRALTPAETYAQLVASSDRLCAVLTSLDADGWSATAESPAGHLPVRLIAMHALWDAWIHERDALLPLGIAPDERDDEVVASLQYAAALGPAIMVSAGRGRRGTLVVEATDPSVRIVVDVSEDVVAVHGGDAPPDAVVLRGRAVDLTEALSTRAPLDQHVPEEGRWLLAGLAELFEVERT